MEIDNVIIGLLIISISILVLVSYGINKYNYKCKVLCNNNNMTYYDNFFSSCECINNEYHTIKYIIKDNVSGGIAYETIVK